MKDIRRFERRNMPEQEVRQASLSHSDSGKLQMRLEAPLIQRFSKPSATTHYPEGVTLWFYDEEQQLRTYLHANKAVTYDDRNIMHGTDSVTVIDYTNGDTVYLEDLVWRQNDDAIFSNHPVMAVNGGRVTYGDGFSSDANMTHLRITRQRGVIEFNEEN